MKFLLTFLPWIVFAVVGTQLDWRYSGLIGLGLTLALLARERMKGSPFDSLVIELSSTIFFTTVTVFAFTDPSSPVRDDLVAMASGWLALTAWGSLAVGAPFTLGIAKRMSEPAAWSNPMFRRVNVVLTSVWAASFTAEAVAMTILLAVAPHASVAAVAIKIASWAVPIVFTMRYPAVVRARALRAAGEIA